MKLEEFSSTYLLEEKFFIVPSKNIGLLMINNMLIRGHNALNLKPITLERLSFEICKRYMEENNILAIDDILGKNLVLDCLKELESKEEDFFFERKLIDINTAEEVYKVIMELKSNKIDVFPDEKDLHKIYKVYSEKLKKLNAMDYCDVMIKALEVKELEDFNKKLIGVASNIEFHNLEKDLFNKLGSKKVKIRMPVKKLDNLPKEYFFKDENKEKVVEKEICFFNEYGIRNEIDFIIKDIFEKGRCFEDVVVSYTDRKYIEHLNIEFEKNNIGIDFAEGLSLLPSTSYRFIESLFNFYGNHYSLNEIKPIFLNGSLNIEKESTLKKENITQGAMHEELVSLGASEGKDAYEKLKYNFNNISSYSRDRREWLKEFFGDILFPIFEKEIEFKDYIERIMDLIKKYVKVKTDHDKSSKAEMLDTLRDIKKIDLNIQKKEYKDMILNYIEDIRVMRKGINPSRIFACPYDNAAYTGRKYLYLIGLDSDTVNSEIVESPILLDTIRRDISLSLSFSKERYKYKKYKIKETLSADFESISIGYSNFNMVDVKAKTPSSVYIELKEEYKEEDICKSEKKNLLAKDLVTSGSSLETLGQCSRKLYFKKAMGLKEKDEIEIDMDRWLNPLEKGILVHEILNIYFDLQKESRIEDELLNIIDEKCKEMQKEIPYILENVYIREKEEIKKYCKSIVKKQELDSFQVLVNELSFGLEKINRIFGPLKEQKVQIGDTCLNVKGAIDRIDINDYKRSIKIVDYKTGSLENFDRKLRRSSGSGKNKTHDYSDGQKFQFFIYKKALEDILKNDERFKDYTIESFSYDFGVKSIDLDFDKELLEKIEDRIQYLLQIDILEHDKMIVYDEADALTCKYCEFKNICKTDSSKLKKEAE
ncbi:MAG: PD-(D/E)XK nuclease family protein [Tissierella sp.]|uniref:PD-(D/E)XK nuclease family protein n=1 Tax=Tissierella sp. TaxID=41274 RepID=UPI003F97B46B